MASVVFAKGNASISINPRETEARLVFVPDPSGDGWDTAAVMKLAAEKHISVNPDPKSIESFLHKAGKSKETLDFVICQGIEPEDAESEKVNWEALPVPDDMAPFQEETLAAAKNPKIFRLKVERIKHEKKVTKPGALPFMHSKEEIAVTWEKKETHEEVAVNPVPRELKYAGKGTKLGTITPSTPGKPGKSIFGRPIPPRHAEEEFCLFGEGIHREKHELMAQTAGFLRIGENWADIVPFVKHSYSINTGIDGLTFFFHFEPGDVRFTPPTGEEILAEAVAKGAGESSLINAGKLDGAVAESIRTREALEAFSLFRTQEAIARVDINPEKTRAVLYLRKGVAGARPLEMKVISQVIKESGVHGFDTEQLRANLHTFMGGKELELRDYVLAEGTPSTRGKDREVEVQAALLPEEEREQVLARLKEWYSRNIPGEDGIDLQKATGFAFVEKGEVAARVGAGSEGEEGKDIYGNVIPGFPGNDPEIKLYGGLELHGSDITAVQNGLLCFEASEKSFQGKVFDYRDAKIEVRFSEDSMEASADFYCAEGPGIPLTVENVEKKLASLEIKKGIDWKGIEEACIRARAGGKVLGCVLAKGQLPIARGGVAVRWLLPVTPPELSAASDEIGSPAESSDSVTAQIKAGTPIAELSEPFPEGRPGYDVQGNEIPIDRGTVLSIEHDDSVREQKLARGKRLIAVRSGELVFDGRELKISSVKAIDGDAKPAAGNINFSGEIRISGNVLPGCTIVGGSHVTVNGLVEGALISAGGKVVAKLGFKGGGRGIIRARAGFEAAFAERGSVMAVGDIQLKKGAILSTIKTNGKLSISAENGKLSGGICQARHGIDAADIGSEKGIRTEVSFGQDYVIKDQIGVCEEEILKLRRKLSEMEEKIKTLLQQKRSLSDEVKKEKIRLVKLLEQFNLKVFILREKFEEHHESEVRIRGTVFPGVVIESHDRYYEVKQKHSHVVFYFDRESGSIREKPL